MNGDRFNNGVVCTWKNVSVLSISLSCTRTLRMILCAGVHTNIVIVLGVNGS